MTSFADGVGAIAVRSHALVPVRAPVYDIANFGGLFDTPAYIHASMERPAATVVHLKRKNGAIVQDCDVYIGRAMYQGGWRLAASKWANPFRLTHPADRGRILVKYEALVRADPELMAALPGLKGARLGCWCKPLPCHGDILVKLLEEYLSSQGAVTSPPIPHIPDDDPIWSEFGL